MFYVEWKYELKISCKYNERKEGTVKFAETISFALRIKLGKYIYLIT